MAVYISLAENSAGPLVVTWGQICRALASKTTYGHVRIARDSRAFPLIEKLAKRAKYVSQIIYLGPLPSTYRALVQDSVFSELGLTRENGKVFPNMMDTIMAQSLVIKKSALTSLLFLIDPPNSRTASRKTFIRNKASLDNLNISRIGFRHNHYK